MGKQLVGDFQFPLPGVQRFTEEQVKVLVEESNVYSTMGITAFQQIAEILDALHIDVQSIPPETFVGFPNRYQSIGRMMFQVHYYGIMWDSTKDLQWFLQTVEEKNTNYGEIHLTIAQQETLMKIQLQYDAVHRKEELLETLEEVFFSGNYPELYFQRLVNTFGEQLQYFFYHQQGEYAIKLADDTAMRMYPDFKLLVLPVSEDVYIPYAPSVEERKFNCDTSLFDSFLQSSSILRSPEDVSFFLRKLGYEGRYLLLTTDKEVLTFMDKNSKVLKISLSGNTVLIEKDKRKRLENHCEECTLEIRNTSLIVHVVAPMYF